MDGHHADAVAARLHVALDGNVGALDLVEKIQQRRRLVLLVGERERKEFVDRIARLGPQARQDRPPAAVLAEQPGIEGERRKARPLAPGRKPAMTSRSAARVIAT